MIFFLFLVADNFFFFFFFFFFHVVCLCEFEDAANYTEDALETLPVIEAPVDEEELPID